MDLPAAPALPGLLARRPLGQGPEAPWVVRADDGAWLVVRRGRRPADLPDHPCLLPVLGELSDALGRAWVMTPYRAGSGLDRRLQRVGGADPALARRSGLAVARGLAALHAAGLVHLDLQASRVLLGSRDEVVLDATCARTGDSRDRTTDVEQLADLLEAVCRAPEGSLARAVALARGGSDAQAVAASLLEARRVRPAAARHAGRRSVRRALLGSLAVVVLLGVAGTVGTRLAGRPVPTAALEVPVAVSVERPGPVVTPQPSPTPTATPPKDWTAVLAGLDRARGAVLAAADETLLDEVDVPGSQAYRRDLALVRALRRGGAVAEGWATTLRSVVERRASQDRAVLAVTDRLAAYVLRDSSGEVVERRAARGGADWTIHLVSTPEGWRIARVAAR